MKRILSIHSIKYVVALVIFTIVLVVTDNNDLFTQYKRYKELGKTEETITYLNSEIERLGLEIDAIDKNPKILERYARERYSFKKENEDVFLITNDTIIKRKK